MVFRRKGLNIRVPMLQENRPHKREVKEQISSLTGGHCPFVGDPFADCFIASINSQNIDQAIYYCGKHFEECEIYHRVTKRERTSRKE